MTVCVVETNPSGNGVRALKAAKKFGHRAVFLTFNPDRYDGFRPRPSDLADEVVTVDTMSAVELYKEASRQNAKALVGFDDFRAPAVALAATGCGLVTKEHLAGVLNARNKDWMRRATANLPSSPRAAVLREVPAASPIGYPCVVKPTDGAGSVGVVVCNDDASFKEAVSWVLRTRTHNSGYVHRQAALVETFVGGEEYSAECVCLRSHWEILGITRKLVGHPPHFVELGHCFPADIKPERFQALAAFVRSALQDVGLRVGAAHVEFKLDPEMAPILIEVNPRIGGDYIVDLVELASGLDMAEIVVAEALGVSVVDRSCLDRKAWGAAAIRYIGADQVGILRSVEPGKDAISAPFIRTGLDIALGERVRPPQNSDDRVAYVITKAERADAAWAAAELFAAATKVCVQEEH